MEHSITHPSHTGVRIKRGKKCSLTSCNTNQTCAHPYCLFPLASRRLATCSFSLSAGFILSSAVGPLSSAGTSTQQLAPSGWFGRLWVGGWVFWQALCSSPGTHWAVCLRLPSRRLWDSSTASLSLWLSVRLGGELTDVRAGAGERHTVGGWDYAACNRITREMRSRCRGKGPS